jgi:glycosyltransferase involved in cell wall biosynthesis
MPKVSVIIPVYNNGKYLTEALESVLHQTYGDVEIIIVNDGSTDDTGTVIACYLDKEGSRIRCLHQANRGPAAARNAGMRNARGTYIAFLDADDIWLPQKLEKQVKLIEQNPSLGCVYCDNHFVDDQRNIILGYEAIREIKLVRGDITADLFDDFFIITSAAIVRAKVLETLGMFNEDLIVGEDYDFFLRLSYAFPVDVIEEKLLERRVHNDSLSRKNPSLDVRNDLSTLNTFLKAHPSFHTRYRSRVFQRLSECHGTLGYHYLLQGERARSLYHLMGSLRYEVTCKAVKRIVRCLLPLSLMHGKNAKVGAEDGLKGR